MYFILFHVSHDTHVVSVRFMPLMSCCPALFALRQLQWRAAALFASGAFLRQTLPDGFAERIPEGYHRHNRIIYNALSKSHISE